MVIQVNERYRIASDRQAWMIQEAREVKGEERWESFAWYSDLGGVVRGIVGLMVREIPDGFGVKEVLRRMGEIEGEVIGSLAPYLEWCKNPGGRVGNGDEVVRQ